MRAEPVFLGVNRYRAQAELRGRSEDTNGNFAAISGHQFLETRNGWRCRWLGGRRCWNRFPATNHKVRGLYATRCAMAKALATAGYCAVQPPSITTSVPVR